jgi:hypothetical protein
VDLIHLRARKPSSEEEGVKIEHVRMKTGNARVVRVTLARLMACEEMRAEDALELASCQAQYSRHQCRPLCTASSMAPSSSSHFRLPTPVIPYHQPNTAADHGVSARTQRAVRIGLVLPLQAAIADY